MKHHQIRALVQIAENGSIRAAARVMHVSQSALTKALRELEEDVGAELLIRSYKGIEFTLAGQALLTHARSALGLLQKAREEIRLLRGGAGARVSIAVTPMLAMQVLPRVLRAFEAIQPDAKLEINEGFLVNLIPALQESRLDFAIAIADPADLPYDLVFEPLSSVVAWPAVRSGHALEGTRSWDALSQATWVMNFSAGSQSETLVAWLQSQGQPAPQRIVNCTSPMLMAELMRRTDLVGYCPQALLDDPSYGAGLVALRVDPPPPPMALGMLSMRGVPLSSAARPLAALFARELRPATAFDC